ncbi:MAG TPA: hypothetical protein VF132_09840 [Rudaea sp.]
MLTALFAISAGSLACETSLPLKGAESIKTCDPQATGCTPAAKLVARYTEATPEDPKLFTIALQSSPWRFYDQDMRILTPEELAGMIKAHWKQGMEKVVLLASWTGVSPDLGSKSLAQKLSDALGGFPVSGMDGFLWMAKDGSTRTTHQAYSMKQGRGLYMVTEGDEVFLPLVAGWFVEVEDKIAQKQDADALMRAGAGWDIYSLCPDHALKTFEAAARMSNSIAAYNAALMRLERNGEGDVAAAKALLAQAAAAGDAKARKKLRELKSTTSQ